MSKREKNHVKWDSKIQVNNYTYLMICNYISKALRLHIIIEQYHYTNKALSKYSYIQTC